MIFTHLGEVTEGFHVTGYAGVPSYLLDAKRAALFDAGFSCLGPAYAKHIKDVLIDRQPAYLFLTHVHFDHCGAAAYLKRIFPDLKIAASSQAAAILSRPNAVKLIGELNQVATKALAEWVSAPIEPVAFEPFTIDLEMNNGDRLELENGQSVQVLATPGHTRDFHSYYLPEKKILVSSEAGGIQTGYHDYIVSEFVYSYQDYIDSMKRLATLDVDIVCQGHHRVFVGDDAKAIFKKSIAAAQTFKNRVVAWLKEEDGDVDRVVTRVKNFEYDPMPNPKQPETAYLLNTRARIQHLKEAFVSVENKSP